MLFLLDTDTVVDVLRRQRVVAQRLAMVSPDDVAVSAMTVSELTYGAVSSSNPAVRMRDTERFIGALTVIPFDGVTAREHARLRLAMRRTPIGHSDLIIAATALAAARTLVTSNLREFGRVPGLLVESWR